MSLTKDDLRQISNTLEPQFYRIRKDLNQFERRTIKKITWHGKLIQNLQAETMSIRKDMKQMGIDLKRSLSRMIKDSLVLISQNHPTREEVDAQINDLRDEIGNPALLHDK